MDHVHQVIRQTGPSLSPFNAWVLLKGLETLSVRVPRQTGTAGGQFRSKARREDQPARSIQVRPDHPQGADAIVR